MGSGVWFKNIISKKKVKGDKSQKSKRYSAPENINGYRKQLGSEKECSIRANGLSIEDAAATRIQSAYRAYVGKKTLRRMRGMVRLQNLVRRDSVRKQASATMSHLNSWSKIQAQIRARRVHMVAQGRLRQKKLENQLKLEAKIHDLEVEWTGGSETIDEALAKIHQREDAAVKRERAMAYAFSHQWRASSNPSVVSGNLELNKARWGWSWTDRWVAARPWESRLAVKETPKKAQKCQANGKQPNKVKLVLPNGKAAKKSRNLPYEAIEKIAAEKVNTKVEEKKKRYQE
ncbi:hypothetical protein OROGR_003089 [Orobanche gracilis]